MQYYRVLPQYDGKVTTAGYNLVANELLTAVEMNKIGVRPECVVPARFLSQKFIDFLVQGLNKNKEV